MDRININPKWRIIIGLGISAFLALILIIKKSKRRKNPWFKPSDNSDSLDETPSPTEQSFPPIHSSHITRNSLLSTILTIKQHLTHPIKQLRNTHRLTRRQIQSEPDYIDYVTDSIYQETQLIQETQNSVLSSLGIDKQSFTKALFKYRHDEEVRRYLNLEDSESIPDLQTCLNINQTLMNYLSYHMPHKPNTLRAELEDLIWREHGLELTDALFSCERYGNMLYIVRTAEYIFKESEFY